MLAEALILATSFQIGPFYQQRADFSALRPFVSSEGATTDVLWPVFTSHRDWWRFCFFTHWQSYPDGGYQFEIMPLWWNGVGEKGRRKKEKEKSEEGKSEEGGDCYWGFFPIWGSHPHILAMYDVEFALWPAWMRYRMPRKSADGGWMTSNAVLFPFFHWRDDGSWGAWPIYGTAHNRSDDHWYALWPIWNRKTSFPDRDTGGAGSSWMLWPLCGHVDREREDQWLFLPPLFSWAETRSKTWAERGNSAPEIRLRCPWPLFEVERNASRERTSAFPIYEHIVNYSYRDHAETSRITRFGWRLVEILPEETRIFPFYVGGSGYTRIWPFWETSPNKDGSSSSRLLALFPIRWVDSVDRNWAKFWTFYESDSNPVCTEHSLFWGLIRWRTING